MQILSFYYRWKNFHMANSYLTMNNIKSFSVTKSDFAPRSKPWVIYCDTRSENSNTGFPSEITFKTRKEAMAQLRPIVQWLCDNGLTFGIFY